MRIQHRKNAVTGHVVEPWRDAAQAGDVAALNHLRNAYIERVELYAGAERCVPLLSGVSDALNFKVGRLIYEDNIQDTETLNQSVDWIVRELQVSDYELVLSDHRGDDNERALLPTTLTHDSVRAAAEHLFADVGVNLTL
ncbi:hypothetical protein AAVH_21517 [Aphelenchoides avenae]|nr:hypothetical protein AAVH_21517 [Aphelenchus avenae]